MVHKNQLGIIFSQYCNVKFFRLFFYLRQNLCYVIVYNVKQITDYQWYTDHCLLNSYLIHDWLLHKLRMLQYCIYINALLIYFKKSILLLIKNKRHRSQRGDGLDVIAYVQYRSAHLLQTNELVKYLLHFKCNRYYFKIITLQ